MTDKPVRLPWETKPYVDGTVATERALAAAQTPRGATNGAAVTGWARTALETETKRVVSATQGHAGGEGRNNILFSAAANLYEIVAAGALDETVVENELRNAMRNNGYETDKGIGPITATLKSARRRGFDNPRDLSGVGTKTSSGEKPPPPPTLDTVPQIERGFWTSRDSLQAIYLAALSRMCSPWAALGHCAARALTSVRPNAMLPPLIGEGSLNWFCAIAAPSGGGKGASGTLARTMVKTFILQRNLGSGEGIIDAYVKPADKETGEPKGLHEAIMFLADEIDTMDALGKRSGSALMGTLRSGFSGETLGFSNRTASSLHLEAQTYRMTFIVNVQPARAGALMDDMHGGTLQRFMWFPGTDSRITIETPPMPASLEIPAPGAWQYPRELKIPYEAVELIRDERARAMRGETDVLDGHSLFIREKFAYALALLDGRDEMTLEDWRLAGIASRVSDHTRQWVSTQLEKAQEDDAAKRGTLQGVSSAASDEKRSNIAATTHRRIEDLMWKHVKESGTKGLSRTEINRRLAGRDKYHLQAGLENLAAQGLVKITAKDRWVSTDAAQ